jgi:hypothetical protein
MLRTSERGTMKSCEFKWEVAYNRRRKPYVEAPALRFGTLIHKALASYYIPGIKRSKVHPRDSFIKAYELDLKESPVLYGVKVEEDERWIDAKELGISMLEQYVAEYGADDNWEVLVTEHPFKVLVYRPGTEGHHYKKPEPWFWYTGVVDGAWRNRSSKEIWITDHKTAASLSDSKLNYLQVDDQAGAYWSWGVDYLYEQGLLKPNQKLAGMLYNFLRKALPDGRESKLVAGKRQYLNLNGEVSKKQPPPYFMRMPIYRDELDREMAKRRSLNDFTRIEMLKAGDLEVTKTTGQFTCPMCPARDACELHEVGADWEEFLASTTREWDPYAEHEIYDSEQR